MYMVLNSELRQMLTRHGHRDVAGAVGSVRSLVLEVVSQFLVKLPWDGRSFGKTLMPRLMTDPQNRVCGLDGPGPGMFLKLPPVSHKPANIDNHRTEH